MSGSVYDEAGATVSGATVTVRSLDASTPYNATATTEAGSYVVNNVPVGVQIEVAVTKEGWTRRNRVTSLQDASTDKVELFFGAPSSSSSTDAQAAGAAYFVSDYPEVASATPGASPIAGDKLSYVVRFSEAMDEDNRDLIEQSYSIETTPVAAALMPTGAVLPANIVIRNNTSFLSGKRRVKQTWNAENTEMTIDFDAPLRSIDDDDKSYTFRLNRKDSDTIEDATGKRLGLTAVNQGQDYIAIKKASLTLSKTSTTAALRWSETHQVSTSFDVKEDDTDPKVVSVDSSDVTRSDKGGDAYTQVNITFSEAMRVFPTETGYTQSVVTLANYRFAFSDDKGKLDDIDMEKTNLTHNAGTVPIEKVLKFNNPANVFIEPGTDDPKIVSVYILKTMLPNNLQRVKVLVEPDVKDPAGNTVSEKNTNSTDNTADNVVIGDI